MGAGVKLLEPQDWPDYPLPLQQTFQEKHKVIRSEVPHLASCALERPPMTSPSLNCFGGPGAWPPGVSPGNSLASVNPMRNTLLSNG